MKKLAIAIFSLTLIVGFCGAVSATPITFTDTTNFYSNSTGPDGDDLEAWGGQSANELEYFGDYVVWSHNFGFDPPATDILSGSLTLSLSDDKYDPWFAPFEFGFVLAEDGTWGAGEVDTGDYNFNINTSYLLNGEFTVGLMSLGGDFFIDKSDLTITYETAPVPEPATLLLLGTGLLGVVAVSRKKYNKKK